MLSSVKADIRHHDDVIRASSNKFENKDNDSNYESNTVKNEMLEFRRELNNVKADI